MVVFAGESLIDMVADGNNGFTPHVGGSVLNSSIALARLTGEAYYMGALSSDQYGKLIEKTLSDSGVNKDLLIKVDRPSTIAYVDLDKDGIAKYRFEDETSAGRLIDKEAIRPFVNGVKNSNAVLVGGISLQSEPCGSAWHWLVDQVYQDSVVFYDPNIRPDFIDNKEDYIKRFKDLVAKVNVIKLSEEDSLYLFGTQHINKEMAYWFQQGVDIVIHTLGEKGVRATLSNGKMIKVPVEPTKVVDTIAAGDSFNAGFLYYLDKEGMLNSNSLGFVSASKIKDALNFANRVARYTVSQQGANPPTLNQI